jgi:hypothetical protein
VTARVLNAKGIEITTSTVEWRGADLVALGPRTALLTVHALNTQIIAVFRMDGVGDVSGTATVNARPFPGQILIWSPGQSIVTIPAPSGAHRIEPRAINDRGDSNVFGKPRRESSLRVVGGTWFPGAADSVSRPFNCRRGNQRGRTRCGTDIVGPDGVDSPHNGADAVVRHDRGDIASGRLR